jgi:3'-5' exoribonuclease
MESADRQTAPTYVRDLRNGHAIDQVLLVGEWQLRATRAGGRFVKLTLSDRTGAVEGIIWDDVDRARLIARTGEPLRLSGTFSESMRYGRQLTVHAFDEPTAVDWNRLVAGPVLPIAELEQRLDALIERQENGHLRELLTILVGRHTSGGIRFRRAFAAQYNHHAYAGGLLEHSVAVAEAVEAAAIIFSGIDAGLAVCGALLHDIGKLDSYAGTDHRASLTDGGKLVGEIPSGYYAVRRQIEQLPAFPTALAEQLLHIILAHHGRLEFGSPVVPSTREAMLVHTMDKLSGDLGSFDRVERETPPGERWSRHDRALGRSVLVDPSHQ